VLTGSTPVYDLVAGEIIKPTAERPLSSRGRRRRARRAAVTAARARVGLSLATPVIVKYRDSRTDTRTELEAWIR
jgi:2,3,4,5-tetrahydropyridine-2-carboxylate N-succinyltransferase